jgi:hypothetical protein
VYFHRGDSTEPGTVVGVDRTVPRTSLVATAALEQLLAGPTTAERSAGYWSQFSAATAGMLHSFRVGNGVAHADFRDFSRIIPNASSSAGDAALLAELDATLKELGTVRTVYSFDGDVAAFYEWLQLAPPVGTPIDAAGARAAARDFLTNVAGIVDPAIETLHWVGPGVATATSCARS